MLKIQGISKSVGSSLLFSDFSLEAESGVIGIVNGRSEARSAILSTIAGSLAPDEGHIYIDEYDISAYPTEAKRATGYMPYDMPFYDDMTVYEFLTFIGEAKKVTSEKLHKQIREALDLLSLSEISEVLISNIGTDDKKLLGVASTLLGNPDIIILDAPFDRISSYTKEKLSYIIRMLGTMKIVIISGEGADELGEIASSVIELSARETEVEE